MHQFTSTSLFSLVGLVFAFFACFTAFFLVPENLTPALQMQSIVRSAKHYVQFLYPARTTSSQLSFSTMSSADSTSSQEKPTHPAPQLALPEKSSDDATYKLDLSGKGGTVKLDHLGPMVVNQDGTLSRISNWDKMTEGEQKNTMRIIGKRNKQRLDALKQQEGVENQHDEKA